MKFIKEIITRKQADTDTLNIDDMAAMLDDAEAEGSSNAEKFNNLAAIQSRIKGTQSAKSDLMQEDLGSVKDFSELVEDILEPEDAEIPETGAPVMTEEDYVNLDNELARMSEELEEQDAAQATDAGQENSQMEVLKGRRQANEAVASAPVPLPVEKAKTERPSAFGTLPRTERPAGQNSRTIVISEAQGGGAGFDGSQVKEIKPAAPAENHESAEQVKPQLLATEMIEREKPRLAKAPEQIKNEGEEAKPKAELSPPLAPRIVEVPAPAAGRSGRRAGRVKTRLLGFEHSNGTTTDPFSEGNEVATSTHVNFPVGWIVVIEGPGRGAAFSLMSGVSQIGRGDDQAIKLDFGDTSISRLNHAAIAYDNEQNSFFLGHGGKANLVRLNDKPVLSTEEINDSDLIRIGETTLRFVALCGGEFNWAQKEQEQADNAANA